MFFQFQQFQQTVCTVHHCLIVVLYKAMSTLTGFITLEHWAYRKLTYTQQATSTSEGYKEDKLMCVRQALTHIIAYINVQNLSSAI